MSLVATIIAAIFLQPAAVAECNSQNTWMHDPVVLPMLLYFHSNDCDACLAFDQLFDEPAMLQRIEEYYVAVRINIDDIEGRACAEIYHVSNAPALIVAHHNGDIVFKSDAYLTEADMKILLEELPGKFANAAIPPPDKELLFNEVVKPIPALQTEPIEPESTAHVFSTVTAYPGEILLTKDVTTSERVTPTPEDIPTPEIPDMNVPEVPNAHGQSAEKHATPENQEVAEAESALPKSRRTYSIQLGFFSEEKNARALHRKAENAGIKDIRNLEELRKGKTYFRILSGACSTLEAAQVLLDEIHELGFMGAVYRY